jgi:Tfp pilus assembly protein PilO
MNAPLPPQLKTAIAPTKSPIQAGTSLVYSALLVVAIILVAWFLIKPQWATVSQQQTTLRQLLADQQALANETQTLAQLVTTMQQATDDIALLDEALPIDARLTKIHVVLESLVQSSGMTLANIAVDSPDAVISAGNRSSQENLFAKKLHLQTAAVTLNLTGSLEQFVPLLQLMEQSSRVLDVESLDIAPTDDGSLSFHLKLKAYFYSQDLPPEPAKSRR